MKYDFFFSYALDSAKEKFLKQFFDDLCSEIRMRKGLSDDAAVGFFGQKVSEVTELDYDLRTALQDSATFVCLVTPAYLGSPGCLAEYNEFRRLHWVTDASDTPRLCKPVVWLPPRKDQLSVLPDFNYGRGAVSWQGMRHVMNHRNESDMESIYREFLSGLAKEVIATSTSTDSPLAAVRDRATRNLRPARVDPRTRPTVEFVYIAGRPDEFADGYKRKHLYSNNGASDWKPYSASDSPIRILAVQVTLARDINYLVIERQISFDEIGGKCLAARIGEARDQNRMVVLLVDCWTLDIGHYRKGLEHADECVRDYFFPNCGVLLPWDRDDPLLLLEEARLQEMVEAVFTPECYRSMQFRKYVGRDDFENRLRDLLTRLSGNIISHGALARSVPAGPVVTPLAFEESADSFQDLGDSERGIDPVRKLVFVSYDPRDQKLFDQLKDFLEPLERQHGIGVWYDSKMEPGDDWRNRTKEAIDSAAVAVLFVSQRFLNSDRISQNELVPLLDAAEKEGVKILCIAVSASAYKGTAIERYRFMNDRKTLDSMLLPERKRELQRIHYDIVKAVRKYSKSGRANTSHLGAAS